VFGLPLPSTALCQPNDNKADRFELLTIDEVQMELKRRAFKLKSALALAKFFIHYGILTADNEKDYDELVERLHRRLEFPIRNDSFQEKGTGC
jgi:hypothetical protein